MVKLFVFLFPSVVTSQFLQKLNLKFVKGQTFSSAFYAVLSDVGAKVELLLFRIN